MTTMPQRQLRILHADASTAMFGRALHDELEGQQTEQQANNP